MQLPDPGKNHLSGHRACISMPVVRCSLSLIEAICCCLLLSVLWWLTAASRFKKSHLSGSLRERKEVLAKSSDWLPRFGNLKRAHIFRPTSIELPSTQRGPKWRAKVCLCPLPGGLSAACACGQGGPQRGDCSAWGASIILGR